MRLPTTVPVALTLLGLIEVGCGAASGENPARARAVIPGSTAAPVIVAARPASQAAAPDPCRLITAEEAQMALDGHRPQEPRRRSERGGHSFFYEASRGTDMVVVSIIEEEGGGPQAKQAQELEGRALDLDPVRGVGDSAFINFSLNGIDIVVGRTRVLIQIALNRGLPRSEMRARLVALGAAAARRIS